MVLSLVHRNEMSRGGESDQRNCYRKFASVKMKLLLYAMKESLTKLDEGGSPGFEVCTGRGEK